MTVSSPAAAKKDPREPEVRLLVDMVRLSRSTLLIAEKGAEKSALIRSVVMPLLASRRPKSQPELAIVLDSWDTGPLAALNARIEEAVRTHAPAAPQPEANASLAARLRGWQDALKVNFIFVFDCFESYLRAPRGRTGFEAFEDELVAVLNDPTVRANFLLSLDDDAEPLLRTLRERVPRFGYSRVRLPRVGEAVNPEAKPLKETSVVAIARKLATEPGGVSLAAGLTRNTPVEPAAPELIQRQAAARTAATHDPARPAVTETIAAASAAAASAPVPVAEPLAITEVPEQAVSAATHALSAAQTSLPAQTQPDLKEQPASSAIAAAPDNPEPPQSEARAAETKGAKVAARQELTPAELPPERVHASKASEAIHTIADSGATKHVAKTGKTRPASAANALRVQRREQAARSSRSEARAPAAAAADGARASTIDAPTLQKAHADELKRQAPQADDQESREPAHLGRSRYTRLAWLGAAAAIAGLLFVSQRNASLDVKPSAAVPSADSDSKARDRDRAEAQTAAAAPQVASRAAETKPQQPASSPQQVVSAAPSPSPSQASTSAAPSPTPQTTVSPGAPAQGTVPTQPRASAPQPTASAQSSGTPPVHTASTPHPQQTATASAKTSKPDPSSVAVASAAANAPTQPANARRREADNTREVTRDARAAQPERERDIASRPGAPVVAAQRAAPPVVTPSAAPVRAESVAAEASVGPRLVINVRNESQRAWAEQIVRPLGERGIRVVGIRVVSSGPDQPDLRYFNLSDRNEVVRIAVALRDFGLRAQQLKHLDDSGSASGDRRYELWLPAGP